MTTADPDRLAAEPDPLVQRLGYLRACIDAAIATPEAFDLPVLLADWGGDLDGLAAVLALHAPFRIYDECDGHGHAPGDEGVTDCVDYLACEDAYLYSVCRECCTFQSGGLPAQTEACVSGHQHAEGRPRCATVAAIAAALTREDTPS